MALILLLAGCGGSSRLAPSGYRSKLALIARQADKAHASVDRAASAKTFAELQARLKAFATSEDRLGTGVSRLKPPKDAEAANAELARGEHDLAAEIRSTLPKLARFTSPKPALEFLGNTLDNAKGGREQDQAVGRLKKLGYRNGS